MSSLADLPEVIGFFGYSRKDDEAFEGTLSALRDGIQRELSALEVALRPIDLETGAGQASALCSAMKASIRSATWAGKGALRWVLRSA